MNNSKPLLTRDEVAKRLRVSTRSVDTLIRLGRLSSVKIGASRRVTEESLSEFINRMESHSE